MSISTASSLTFGVSPPFVPAKPASASERNAEAAAKSEQIVADFNAEVQKKPHRPNGRKSFKESQPYERGI